MHVIFIYSLANIHIRKSQKKPHCLVLSNNEELKVFLNIINTNQEIMYHYFHVTHNVTVGYPTHSFLLTPRQILPPGRSSPKTNQRRLDSSITTLLCIICLILSRRGKSKEVSNQGMKVQVKRSFKNISFFFSTKNNLKAEQLCMKFSKSLIQVCRGESIPYFILNSIFSVILSFSKNISTSRQGSTK